MLTLYEARREQRLVTGLLFVDPNQARFQDDLALVETPLAHLPLDKVRPPQSALDEVMEQLRTGRA